MAFSSHLEGFVPFATDDPKAPYNSTSDVFLRDTQTGETRLVSPAQADGTPGHSSFGAISGDGHWVAFVGQVVVPDRKRPAAYLAGPFFSGV